MKLFREEMYEVERMPNSAKIMAISTVPSAAFNRIMIGLLTGILILLLVVL